MIAEALALHFLLGYTVDEIAAEAVRIAQYHLEPPSPGEAGAAEEASSRDQQLAEMLGVSEVGQGKGASK